MSAIFLPLCVGCGLLDGCLPASGGPVRAVATLLALVAPMAAGLAWPARLVRTRLAVLAFVYLGAAAAIVFAGRPDSVALGALLLASLLLAPVPHLALPLATLVAAGALRAYGPQPATIPALVATAVAILIVANGFRRQVVLARDLARQRGRLETLLADFEEDGPALRWEAFEDGRLRVSPRAAGAAGPRVELHWPSLLGAGCRTKAPAHPDFLRVRDAVTREQPFRDCVLPLPIDGERRLWSFSGRPVLDAQGRVRLYRGVVADVTDRRAADGRDRVPAGQDALTGLRNRSAFLAALGATLARGEALELVLVDIDGFRSVNDALGTETGDSLLATVAGRLAGTVGSTTTLARVGGDEFAILCPAGCFEGAPSPAARMRAALAEPFGVAGRMFRVGASFGVARAPADGTEAASVFRAAVLALDRAKTMGGGIVIHHDPSLKAELGGRRALQVDLRSALAQGELELEYQPIVDLATGLVVSCEALARWNHPTRGRVSPALFVEIAEQSGMIAQLGAWVIRTAVLEAATWPDPHVGVTVNVSPLQFRAPTLVVEAVEEALALSGLDPARLMLEITETALLDADRETAAALDRLRAGGVAFALDDFGTGNASLSTLDRFHFDALKADRSFLRHSDSGTTEAILQAVARLGAELGMRTIAEGVETEAQRRRLLDLGYDWAQGFLFARPMLGPAIRALLAPAEPPAQTLGVTATRV